jgi:predicted 3-demethylubiquinone-9 3-methyltransferase (glyoxalase superfamily)
MPDTAIETCIWFDTQAEDAANLYVSLIPNSKINRVNRQHMPDGSMGPAFMVAFELAGQKYNAMNGGPKYKLNEAASIMAFVDTQEQVDHLWNTLIEGGGAESRCGWLKDRYGLSWQIIPRALITGLSMGGQASGRVMQAMMGMNKFIVAALESAAKG